MTSVNDKLKRRIRIFGVFPPFIPANKTIDLFNNIITSIPNLSKSTCEIHFFVTQNKFAIAFLNWIAGFSTTNVQHVAISISQEPGIREQEDQIEEYPKLPIIANLTSITFQPYRRGQIEGPHGLETFLQVLIDSAPNLTSLNVCGTFCPNLAGCKKLNVLIFHFKQFPRIGPATRQFNLATIIEMLAQVKDSLTEMTLHYDGNSIFNRAQVTF